MDFVKILSLYEQEGLKLDTWKFQSFLCVVSVYDLKYIKKYTNILQIYIFTI